MKECPNCHNKCDSKFCPECGADLTGIPDVEMDDNTNEPFETYQYNYDKPDDTIREARSKRKKPVGCIIVLLIIIAALAIGGFYYMKYSYIQNAKTELAYWTSEMASTVSDESNDSKINSCEELINFTNKVWGDAIKATNIQALKDVWGDFDYGYDYDYGDLYNEETREYVEGVSDFNEALERLYSTDEVMAFDTEIILLYRDASAQKIPEGIPDIKNAYTDLLLKYNDLVDWCTWPRASYDTYMEESQKKYDAFWEALNKFGIVMQQQ